MEVVQAKGGGGSGAALTVTDGVTSVSNVSTVDFLSGATVSNPGGGVANVAISGAGGGTVTSVSVVSANGLAGTVATATTTPAITLSTTVNAPILAGNGTAISAATTTGTGSTAVLSASPTLTGTLTVPAIETATGALNLNETSFHGVGVGGNLSVSSTSAASLVVGANGSTNPALKVNSNTGQVTGVIINGAAAGSGVGVAAISSGTNENLTLDAKGTGSVTIGGISTGGVVLGNPTTANTQSVGDNSTKVATDAFVTTAVGNSVTPFFATVGFTNANYITDGTADDVQINAAIAAAISAGGGTVFIKAGTYSLAATIALNGSNVTLMGEGAGTHLKTANASNIDGITITGTGTIYYQVRSLWIDCNKANNTFGAGVTINTPWSNPDPNGVFDDLLITDCNNNGVQFTGSSDTRVPLFHNIFIKRCNGNGIYMPFPSSTDGVFDTVICDTIALSGLYIGGANHHFINCKSFYCGSAIATGGVLSFGYYIAEYNNYFVNCEAQDNYIGGFFVDGSVDGTNGAKGCTFTDCVADSNNQSTLKKYTFTVTAANATLGATYTNNSITFTVAATIAGATTLVAYGSGAPTASGTLTKASGTGDATITFASSVVTTTYGAGFMFSNVNSSQVMGGISITRPFPSFTQAVGVSLIGTTTNVTVNGMWFNGNTIAWSDTSSGTNYRIWCTGQSTESSTVPGAVNMGTNNTNYGTGTAHIVGSGTRMLIDGGSQPIELDNATEIFFNSSTPTIDMFNASARTLAVTNAGGGTANLSVTNNISATGATLSGLTASSAVATDGSKNLVSVANTGTGNNVLATSPTITTASLGSSTATTQTPADNSTKLATTAYVDAAVLGQNFKEAALVATTANLVGVYLSGVFTYTATGTDNIDGVNLALGNRVLVKNQTTTFQNGIYAVTTAGSLGVAGVLTRSSDANTSGEFKTGDSIFVTSGTVNANTTWAYTGVDSPTLGTDAITYAQTAGQGTVTAGNGITVTGLSVAIDTSITVDKTTTQTLTNKTLTSPTLTTPALGTPSSGTGTNITGIPAANILAGSFGAGAYVISTSLQAATIELGNATDTTLSRVSAGVIAVEGVTIVDVSSAQTLTTKRITRRTTTTTQSATPAINSDNMDVSSITGLAQAITSMTTNLTGTPVQNDFLEIQITDNGTARAITWGTSFSNGGLVNLPTTTVISTKLRVLLEWDSTTKWTCVAVA